MNIKKLILQGFKSFTNPQTVDFSNYNGELIFVSGENKVEPKLGANGVGKSALMSDALSWILFGKTSVNLKAGDIHSWNNDVPTKITLWFDDYILERTWSPNTLILNSNVVTQEELENIIGMNFNSFQYSVLISQFSSKFVDLSPTQRLDIFTEIMDDILANWDIYKDKAKTESDIKKQEIEDLKLEISSSEGELKSLDLHTLKIKSSEFEKDRKETIKKIKEKLDSINIKELEDEVAKYSNKVEENKRKIKELQEERNELENLKDEKDNEKLKYEKELAILNTHIKSITETIDKLKNSSTICEVCGSLIDEKDKAARLDIMLKEFFLATKDHEDTTKYKNGIKLEITDINDKLSKNRETVRILSDSYSDLNMEINKKGRRLGQITEEYERNHENLKSIIDKENPYTSLISESKKKINYLKRFILHQKDTLESTMKEYEIAKYWIRGFKDIKLMLTSESLFEFEIEINNNLQKLGMNTWEVKLDVDTETKSGSIKRGFSVLVKSPTNDKPVPFECWSGGEGQRIRMAITLGLSDFIKNRRGVTCDVMVFDEPSQHLSEEGIYDLLEALNAKAKNDKLKIFFIDHRSLETSNWFDSIIKVVKTKDGSEVTQ